MILYRKSPQLRVRRMAAPEPPFWCATSVAPYSPRRSEPVAIDHGALRASSSERLEVAVCSDVAGALERAAPLAGPLLIEATGAVERIFRRGNDALAWCGRESIEAVHLVSADGAPPDGADASRHVLAVSAWPADLALLETACADAAALGARWGLVVPVVFPVTTDLALLESLADLAAGHGAAFLGSFTVDLEPTARRALAQAAGMEQDDDRWAMLFHGRVEPLALATERHLAALAHERTLGDSVPLPGGGRSNWNASAMLTLLASRMMAMELDLDLAGRIYRSARGVASLEKPLTRIAESASLSIVGTLDETSVDALTEWIETGGSSFGEWVNEQWRLRRR